MSTNLATNVVYGFEVTDNSFIEINNGAGFGSFNQVITGGGVGGGNYLRHARLFTDPTGQISTAILPTLVAAPAISYVTAQILCWFRIPFYPSATATIFGYGTGTLDGPQKARLRLRSNGALECFTYNPGSGCPGDPTINISTTLIPLNVWVYLSLVLDIVNDITSPGDSGLADGQGCVGSINGVPFLGTGAAYGNWAGCRGISNFTLNNWFFGSDEATTCEMHFDQITLGALHPAIHSHNSLCIGAPPPTCPINIPTNDCINIKPAFGGFSGDPTLGGGPNQIGPIGIPYYPIFVPPTVPPPGPETEVAGPTPSPAPNEQPGTILPCYATNCIESNPQTVAGGGTGCNTDLNAPVVAGGCP